PASKEMTSIAKGDAFVYLGAGMEGFAESAAGALASQDVKLIEIGEHEELFHAAAHDEEHHHAGHDHGDHDPNIWLDPLEMVDVSNIIEDELISLKPDKEEVHNHNFNALKEDLVALDHDFLDVLHAKKDKQMLVSHAAFGYWEERYGIEQIAINGLS